MLCSLAARSLMRFPFLTSLLVVFLTGGLPASQLTCSLPTCPAPQWAAPSANRPTARRPVVQQTGFRTCQTDGHRTRVQAAVWNPQENRQWRHTRDGWREIEIARQPAIQYLNLPRPAPLVHPFRITLLLLLSVLAAVAWASDEWDWGRLSEAND